MIRVNESESFPITVSLLDESSLSLATGQTVAYDIRQMDDNPLAPPINGTLTESTVEPGIYKTTATINDYGLYLVYATCSGFLSNTEEVVVNEKNVYDITESNRHYNISVEDIPRTTASGSETASQITRKVPFGVTDYITTKIKADDAADWSNPVSSGIVYAWYNVVTDTNPYKMGDPA